MQRSLSGHPTVEFQARPCYAKCEFIIVEKNVEIKLNVFPTNQGGVLLL